MALEPLRSPSRHRPAERGFTVVELMTVVIIIGVLAIIAAVAYAQYIRATKSMEAINVINGVKAAQESYKDDTLQYLNVTPGGLNNPARLYPQNPMGKKQKATFTNPFHADYANGWRVLAVDVPAPVQYGFTCQAGPAGTSPPQPGVSQPIQNWPGTVAEPWYVVKAVGDLNGDGVVASIYSSASFTGEIYSEREGE